ncbi:hypothetical protein EON81_04600 [bacterium]|nr:MAG: hypothetical protein EON81_04600 [bacterium]
MATGSVYRTTTEVGPGHRIEILALDLAEGERVEVTVRSTTPLEQPSNVFVTLEALDLPLQDTIYWEERERELKESREAWSK